MSEIIEWRFLPADAETHAEIAGKVRERRIARLEDAGLTYRESQVALLIAEGMTDQEIAERLFLAVSTAKGHVASVRAHFQARNRTEAALSVLKVTGRLL